MTSLRNRVGTEKEMLSKQASTHWHPEEGTSRNCSQPTARAKSSASDTGRGEGSWSFSSAQFSCSVVSDSLPPHGSQEARLPCPSPTPRACSNSSIELVMPSNYLILCHPLLLLPSIFPNIRVFSNESVLCIMWPKYWSFSISPSNEYSGLVSFRMDWFDLLAVQGTLKSLLQHNSSKPLPLQCSAFFMVQLSDPYMGTGKTTALTR